MKQHTLFAAALILLPLALTAPMPRGIPTGIIARRFVKSVCSEYSLSQHIQPLTCPGSDPTKCDPADAVPEPPVVAPPNVGCGKRLFFLLRQTP